MNAASLLIPTMCVLLVGGCAHPPKAPKGDPAPSVPTYPERVQERLEQAESQEVHLVRYNPTPCGCPPHEIQLDGLWQRVQLDVEQADDPVLLALQRAEEMAREKGDLRHHTLQGQLSSDLSMCGRGALMVHLDPVAYGAPESEETAEGDDAPDSPPEDPEEN